MNKSELLFGLLRHFVPRNDKKRGSFFLFPFSSFLFPFRGFTLAEVLITLGIIGVVAAITIPALMNKTNDMENRTAFKKTYSEIAQATQKIMTDNGGTLDGAFAFTGTTRGAGTSNIYNTYAQHLKFVRVCAGNSDWPNCWSNTSRKDVLNWGFTPQDAWFADVALLSNGQGIRFTHEAECNSTTTMCAQIWIDTNGPNKKPNIWGKDIYMIQIYSNRIAPRGWDIAEGDYGCCSNLGSGCAAWVIQNRDY